MGTVGYMSPEQAAGRAWTSAPTSSPSAQFSTRLATGDRAFRRDSSAETLTAIIREEPPAIDQKSRARAGASPLDHRALPREGTGRPLRLDA